MATRWQSVFASLLFVVLLLGVPAFGQARLGPGDLPDFPPRPGAGADADLLRRHAAAEKARAAGAEAALRTVRIDPATLRGREGFFRVGRSVNGYWWLIDPNGLPFYYKGVCAVNRAGTMGGRRAVPGGYAPTVDKLYNYPRDANEFVAKEIARVRAWGFSGLGAWTTSEFFDRGLAYTEIMDFIYLRPWIGEGPRRDIPDIFDGAWLKAIDEHARKICPPQRGSKMLVGYFLDNEIGFAPPRGAPAADKFVTGEPGTGRGVYVSLLQRCLALEAGRPARRAAWEWLLARHGGKLGEVAKAWGVAIADPDAPRQWAQAGRAVHTAGYIEDCWAWVRHFVDRYARVTCDAVRRHDANHMILGVRWGGPPSRVELEAMRPYLEVMSANNYQDQFFERMDIYWRAGDMPVLNGEFAWHGYPFHGVPHTRPDGPLEADVARMLRAGHKAMERACRHPGLVGYTWYRWVQPTSAPLQCGLVDFADKPNAWNVEELKLVNARAEHIRAEADAAAGKPPAPVAGTVHLTVQTDTDFTADDDKDFLNLRGITFTLTCRDGRWAMPEGRWKLVKAETVGAETSLSISAAPGEGEGRRYDVRLTRRGDLLRGPATASREGRKHEGYALGFIE